MHILGLAAAGVLLGEGHVPAEIRSAGLRDDKEVVLAAMSQDWEIGPEYISDRLLGDRECLLDLVKSQ